MEQQQQQQQKNQKQKPKNTGKKFDLTTDS